MQFLSAAATVEKNSAVDILTYFSYFYFRKKKFDMSCKQNDNLYKMSKYCFHKKKIKKI